MKTTIAALVAATVVIAGGWWLLAHKTDKTYTTNGSDQTATTTQNAGATNPPAQPVAGSTNAGDIRITTPGQNDLVSSPLTVSGTAKGSWFFEATAPVFLDDANGKTIAQGHITATGDWMTTNFVPFTGTLTWTASSTGTTTRAAVVFMNDNPSGDPALQKSVTIPVYLNK